MDPGKDTCTAALLLLCTVLLGLPVAPLSGRQVPPLLLQLLLLSSLLMACCASVANRIAAPQMAAAASSAAMLSCLPSTNSSWQFTLLIKKQKGRAAGLRLLNPDTSILPPLLLLVAACLQ